MMSKIQGFHQFLVMSGGGAANPRRSKDKTRKTEKKTNKHAKRHTDKGRQSQRQRQRQGQRQRATERDGKRQIDREKETASWSLAFSLSPPLTLSSSIALCLFLSVPFFAFPILSLSLSPSLSVRSGASDWAYLSGVV